MKPTLKRARYEELVSELEESGALSKKANAEDPLPGPCSSDGQPTSQDALYMPGGNLMSSEAYNKSCQKRPPTSSEEGAEGSSSEEDRVEQLQPVPPVAAWESCQTRPPTSPDGEQLQPVPPVGGNNAETSRLDASKEAPQEALGWESLLCEEARLEHKAPPNSTGLDSASSRSGPGEANSTEPEPDQSSSPRPRPRFR